MTSTAQIVQSIVSGDFSFTELTELQNAVQFARSRIRQKTKFSIKINDRVQFYSTKRNMKFTGTVKKVKTKYVEVATDQGPYYNVPAEMLELIA